MTRRLPAYGWSDFDQEVVQGLVENDPRFIDRRANGWIASPLAGQYDNKLPWTDGNFKKGSVPCGDPPASFRAAPTYVLERPLDNVIAGRDLIADAIAGRFGTVEATRLGNENSTGALTWNVFRSLQEAGSLNHAVRTLVDLDTDDEPELFVWGRRITSESWTTSNELASALSALDEGAGQRTEPDVCLHVPGWAWLVIDASFGPKPDTVADAVRVEALLDQYSRTCPGLFDEEAIRGRRLRDIPPLLLRTIALAHLLRGQGERALAVALVRENDPADVERKVSRCLASTAEVGFRRGTWESIYRGLDRHEPRLGPLRAYLEDKSFGLRPAFALPSEAGEG